MSHTQRNDLATMLVAAITSMSIGTFVLQALSAFILGIIGALAGWCFNHFISPKLLEWKQKYQKKAQ